MSTIRPISDVSDLLATRACQGPEFRKGPPDVTEFENDSVVEKTEYTDEEMHALIDETMTDFDDGDLVAGTIVQVERDEVLLDIGYKSEGVIPARELSIRKDADPSDIVSIGDNIAKVYADAQFQLATRGPGKC